MKFSNKVTSSFLMLGLLSFSIVGCDSLKAVSYTQDVKPILEKNCFECHQQGGQGFIASGVSMVTYAELMQGTANGPMIIAGDVESSNLIVLMEGRADPSIKMPQAHGMQKKSVAKEDLDTIKLWIEQGAKYN